MSNDLMYHRNIQAVQEADRQYILKKDRQYNASWKKRGGVGAFFTIVRPWDRFVNMLDPAAMPGDQREAPIAERLQKPVPAFDMFAAIKAEGLEGPDGSLIACIRDLRRYLTLVEAHMIEEIQQTPQIVEDYAELERRILGNGLVSGRMNRDLHAERAEREGVTREEAKAKSFAEDYRAGTPEDGGHHAAQPLLYPWVVSANDIDLRNAETDVWDCKAHDVYVLTERIDEELWAVQPPEIQELYRPAYERHEGSPTTYADSPSSPQDKLVGYWLDIAKAPPAERVRWRELPAEMNLREAQESQHDVELYSWFGDQLKYILRPAHDAWRRGSNE